LGFFFKSYSHFSLYYGFGFVILRSDDEQRLKGKIALHRGDDRQKKPIRLNLRIILYNSLFISIYNDTLYISLYIIIYRGEKFV